jgi:hypothetical protein
MRGRCPYVVRATAFLALTACGSRTELIETTEVSVPEVAQCNAIGDPCFSAYVQASQAAQRCFGWATLSPASLTCEDCGLPPDSLGDCAWPDGARVFGVFVPELGHSQVRLVSATGKVCAQFDTLTAPNPGQLLLRHAGTHRGTVEGREFVISVDDKGTTITCDNDADVFIPLAEESACNIPHISYCCNNKKTAC